MAGKNLLSDTDYTKGWDNRYGVAVAVGRVSKIEVSEKGANVRVIMPDRIDHNDQPLISKPIPVMQIASKAKKSFTVPRVNDNVLMVKLPNGTSNYAVVGSFYTKNDPPPVTDPMLDYTLYDDGSTMQFDASKGELTWKLKGAMAWDNEKGATLKFKEAITIESSDGDINIKAPSGTILLDQQTIHLKGTLIFEGDIQHTGNMNTSGTHTDSHGLHTGAAREDLEARVRALEERMAQLEARIDAK